MATSLIPVTSSTELKLSDFEVGPQIGKGQFSVVYKARCKVDQKMVALKKIQLYEMTDVKARTDCMKEIQLLQVGRVFIKTFQSQVTKPFLSCPAIESS